MVDRLDLRVNAMFFVATLACCAGLAASQPVYCNEDSHCFDGYFCDPIAYRCQNCLRCQDLKREPLPNPQACIKSVRECGFCLKDLVEDRSGDLTCVPPTGGPPSTEGLSSTTVVWIATGLVIGLFVIVAAAVIIRYMLKNSTIFKFKVDTNIGASLPPVQYAPTAPESPPPYSPPRAAEDLPPFRPGEDISRPLIDGYQPPLPAYESQDRQNVSMFNTPAYVRLYNGPRTSERYNDVNENYAPLVHDEDTTPSVWEPPTNYNDNNGNPAVNTESASSSQDINMSPVSNNMSSALAIARNTDLIHSPPASLGTPQQINPLNGHEEANGEEGAHAHNSQGSASARTAAAGAKPSSAGNGNYNVMNVNQVITISLNPNTETTNY